MARAQNPYAGQYAPSRLGIGKEDLTKALKGLNKIPHPNRHLSENAYKKGLKKEQPKEG